MQPKSEYYRHVQIVQVIKDRQLINFRPSKNSGQLSTLFSSFLVTTKKKKGKNNKFAVTQSTSKVDLTRPYRPYSKLHPLTKTLSLFDL